MTVRIVTDSTSDLPPETARELGITVVPLNVHFGDLRYQDSVDIGPDEFYRKLAQGPILPTTSQPSPGDVIEVYRKLGGEAGDIISIHVSAKLSGTYNSAMLAVRELEAGPRIEVIDSRLVSAALGVVVIVAAKAAQLGKGLEEVKALIHRTIPKVQILALIDTLEYLHRGGRIGKAQELLGSILKMKPMITIKDGEVYPAGRVRTRAKAIDRLVEVLTTFTNIEELCIVHSTSHEDAEKLADRAASVFPRERIYITQFGPVVGVYVGPGSLGWALVERDAISP